MPLSEHEQRLLEQMERALYAEDPKFATSMRSARGGAGDRRRIAIGVVGLLVGLGLLVAGVAAKLVIVGVLGFLAMLGGLWLAISALRPAPEQPAAPRGARGSHQHHQPVAEVLAVQAAVGRVPVRSHGGALASSPRDRRLLSHAPTERPTAPPAEDGAVRMRRRRGRPLRRAPR